MDHQPYISVVMSVRNGEAYLHQAVDSILAQTFSDFEFIIINDGSTDSTQSILKNYADPRIILLKNKQSEGLAAALNKGIGSANGRYIARMDADDIAFPERFAQQIDYLEAHPEVGILGTQVIEIDSSGSYLTSKSRPLSHGPIVWSLLAVKGGAIAHPTAMIRREVLQDCGGYDSRYTASQDLDLWLRNISTTRMANLDEPLLYYRRHMSSKTAAKSAQERQFSAQIRCRTISEITGRDITPQELKHLEPRYLRDHLLKEAEAIKAINLLLDTFNELVKEGVFTSEDAEAVRQRMVQHIMLISRRSPQGSRYLIELVKTFGHLLLPDFVWDFWWRLSKQMKGTS